ncbi:unnamed protein product [Prunus armeniaca]|uniref:Uncharacterized protein n=1 Tax=Prunus armeniaca TaxID=36596 RepID=A0A6J5VFP9_PRUAR|nr:unnamed protein product [Prunus armeniaca]
MQQSFALTTPEILSLSSQGNSVAMPNTRTFTPHFANGTDFELFGAPTMVGLSQFKPIAAQRAIWSPSRDSFCFCRIGRNRGGESRGPFVVKDRKAKLLGVPSPKHSGYKGDDQFIKSQRASRSRDSPSGFLDWTRKQILKDDKTAESNWIPSEALGNLNFDYAQKLFQLIQEDTRVLGKAGTVPERRLGVVLVLCKARGFKLAVPILYTGAADTWKSVERGYGMELHHLSSLRCFTETSGRPPKLPTGIMSVGAVVGCRVAPESVRHIWNELKTYNAPIQHLWWQVIEVPDHQRI